MASRFLPTEITKHLDLLIAKATALKTTVTGRTTPLTVNGTETFQADILSGITQAMTFLDKISLTITEFPYVGVTQQISTTVAGTIEAAGAGNVTVIVTADNFFTEGPQSTISVAVANDDTATIVAGKIRTGLLEANNDINDYFEISGTGTTIILTSLTPAVNDLSMNISIDNDDSVGLTPALTSTIVRRGHIE